MKTPTPDQIKKANKFQKRRLEYKARLKKLKDEIAEIESEFAADIAILNVGLRQTKSSKKIDEIASKADELRADRSTKVGELQRECGRYETYLTVVDVRSLNLWVQVVYETSEHGGYCSGNECSYSSENKICHLHVSDHEFLVNGHEARVFNPSQNPKIMQNIEKKLGVHLIGRMGSFYCDLDSESERHGLDIHDYRITVVDYEYR